MEKLYNRYIQSLFFSTRFYRMLVLVIVLYILSYLFSWIYLFATIALFVFLVFVLLDYIILYTGGGVRVTRQLPERFSNGDQNKVSLLIRNRYPFRTTLRIIDDLPEQFQRRNFSLSLILKGHEKETLVFMVRPVERGEYRFYNINTFIKSPLSLIVRRSIETAEKTVKVYPSYFSLRQFELVAYSNSFSDAGSRKIRKIGHSLEFEQIREYVTGDDIRSINWKATGRKGGQLMVNSFTDERSQQVYCIIDKGRIMKMPFEGMTLLDHAINATLILSRVALIKQDKAGLVTFAENIGHFLPADKKATQMANILEALYNQETKFLESDYEKLYALVRSRITQRSLIVLFTNFESLSGLERQLPYLRAIARNHLVLVIFFENTELSQLIDMPADSLERLYIKTIAEKFAFEKRAIVKELQQHGIFTILTPPEKLTVNTVNKYLELKARNAI